MHVVECAKKEGRIVSCAVAVRRSIEVGRAVSLECAMSTGSLKRIHWNEYLERERLAETKSDFYGGEVFT